MSTDCYLYCEETGECVEIAIRNGGLPFPRIEANALQAFLTYHMNVIGSPLVMVDVDSLPDDRNLHDSFEEAAAEYESMSSFHGYKPPILKWTEVNYLSLAKRSPGLEDRLKEYEQAPSGGVWVRRTADGRII